MLNIYNKNYNKKIEDINRIESRFKTEKNTLGSQIREIEEKKILLNHYSQRLLGNWNDEIRNRFICRILNGYPVPEFIICEVIRQSTGIKKRYLIDGLQRLTYSLNFKNNLFKIGKSGSESNVIPYIEEVKDENGNVLTDEDGDPLVEVKEIDVVGKTYSDLPKYLQDRFDKYNITVTTFFDCTEEEVSYHIRNYNSHIAMNTEQKAKTHASELVAKALNNLEKHNFFVDCTKYSNKNLIKGNIARCISNVVMWENFKDSFKSNYTKNIEFLSENATQDMFDLIEEELDELYEVIDEDLMDMFTTRETFLFMVTYHTYKQYGIEAYEFGNYISWLKSLEDIDTKMINGDSFELIGTGHTTDKKVITRRLAIYEGLMREFFEIEDAEDAEDVEDVEDNTEELVETDDTLEDLVFGADYDIENNEESENNNDIAEVENIYNVPTYGEQKFIKDFNDTINFFGTTKNEQTEMAMRSYLMCAKDQRELDEFDIQCNLNNDKHTLKEYDDVLLYTGMLADYAMRKDIEYSNMYTDCKNVPALVKLVQYSVANDIDDEYVEKWFGRYAQLYDNRIDDYYTKDVYTRYEFFKEDFDTYYGLCSTRVS